MPRRPPTDADKLQEIRAWFERHRDDYSDDIGQPPQIWSVYFAWLLDHVVVAREVEREG